MTRYLIEVEECKTHMVTVIAHSESEAREKVTRFDCVDHHPLGATFKTIKVKPLDGELSASDCNGRDN